MSSVESLREFVTERLTAAAEEIFTVFQQTVAEYEEELGRQRRLLDIVLKPELKLHRTELPQQHVCKEEEEEEEEEVLSSLDQEEPEPPQIKEEEEEVCSSQEGEQLVLKQETDTFMLTPTHEGSDHREPEPTSDQQLLSHSSPVAENRHQEGGGHVDPEPAGNVGTQPQKRRHKNTSDSDNVHKSPTTKSHCDTEAGKKTLKCDTAGKDGESVSPGNVGMKSDTVTSQPFNTFVQRLIHNSPLKNHEGNHKGSQVYSCKTCGRHLKSSKSLRSHMRIHTDQKPFVCSTCGKIFRHKCSLNSHMKIHTFGACGSVDSTGHSSIHTGERPYSCDTCGKGFYKTYRLREHILIHTGEKPHTCGTCGRTFRLKGDLTVHIRTHTGEKPYSCDTCGNKFQRSSHLKKHMKVHRLKT